MLTPVTPSSARTAFATPVWKWLRIGQPAVVSDTITSTTPLAWISIAADHPELDDVLAQLGVDDGAQGLGDLVSGGHGSDCGRRPARPRRAHLEGPRGATCVTPRRLREERYYIRRRDMRPANLARRGRSPAPGGEAIAYSAAVIRPCASRRASRPGCSAARTASPGRGGPSGPGARAGGGSAARVRSTRVRRWRSSRSNWCAILRT